MRPLRAFRFSHPDLDTARSPGFAVTPTGRLDLAAGNEALRQQLLLLISTVPGERVLRPDYGCELLLLTFSPNDGTTAGLAVHYVRRAIERYAPDVRILRLDAGPSPDDPGRLDVNLSASDPRPVEALRLRNHFEFAGLPDVVVPAISSGQQLAEKLHAYTRDYATGENTRAKDLYDMLIIAAQLRVPPLAELAGACQTTFALRHTQWPPSLNPPPPAWARPWGGFVRDYHIPFASLADAYAALVPSGPPR